MNENDVTLTFTEYEHEIMIDMLRLVNEMYDFTTAYGLSQVPTENEIVQRYDCVKNLKERFEYLYHDRFSIDETDEEV